MYDLYFVLQFLGLLESSLFYKSLELKKKKRKELLLDSQNAEKLIRVHTAAFSLPSHWQLSTRV